MENLLQAMKWFGGYLKHCVTTIRDCGSSNRMAIPLRDAVKRGAVLGPDIVACDYMLGPQSMYQLGREMTMTMSIVDGADAFRAAARDELALGADFVKIYASASGAQGLAKDSAPILTRGEVRAAVEAAIPNFLIHEHCYVQERDYIRRLGRYDDIPVRGRLAIPQRPGIGNELSEFALTHCEKETVR